MASSTSAGVSSPPNEKQTIDMFLVKALEKMERNKRFPKLDDALKTSTDLITTKMKGLQGKRVDSELTKDLDSTLNKLVDTFKMACETRLPKNMSISLDCLQRLMAYGYIRGDVADTNDPEKKLIDKVIDIIAFNFESRDENVQLQIIKAFLTAVISPICGVHENSLMTAIRICYNIYLASPKTSVNQTTARATLTQMVNIVFQRMATVVSQQQQQQQQAATAVSAPTQSTSSSSLDPPPSSPSPSTEESSSSSEEANPISPSPSETNPIPASPSLEASPSPTPISPRVELAQPKKSLDPNLVYTDCFLIFRALCNMSMKEVPDGSSIGDSGVRSKIMALELLLTILESYSPIFRENEKFITNAIKKYLCISILMNGVSSVPRVFSLSLSLFSSLIIHFKDHLKDEIGVFFPKIFLQILESPNSTLQQKHSVLQVLQQICKNPQTLVDIFLNYDCDPTAGDIFERMVKDLSQIAKGSHTIDTVATPAQDQAMKSLALGCSVTILRSLVDWSKELNEEKKNNQEVKNETESAEDKEKEEIMLKFEKQRYTKQQLEYAKQQFNVKPKKGINFLISVGLIENTPEAVAKWLRTEGLEKEMIGEYLGDRDEFCSQVNSAYVGMMNFRNMEIDAAFRQFFLNFRLPKESQLIDRIILKFAEKYFADNPESIFANADAAYLFAYAVIMLGTDLHNPAIKKKMTRPDWKRIVRGENDGKDFPEKFLMDIYDRIQAAPFRTADEMVLGDNTKLLQPTQSGAVEILDPKQRQLLFLQESQRMVKKSQQLIKEKMKNKSSFFKSTHIEHVKPMFEMSWCAMLATLSVVLENTENDETIALCLQGFKCAIHVSSLFFMETQRDAFVTSLVKFTLLNNVREMRQKNIESVKTLIEIAHTDGNYLQESWSQVLTCISQLEKLHLLSGTKESPQNSKVDLNKKLAEQNASVVVAQIDPAEIDRIFTRTSELNSDAIVHFVQCLCHVSLTEINSQTPRTFSLQKLVEIAYFNMDRIRYVWSKIWTVLTNHFTTVGCDVNLDIAMYAIDSLRQLATKFLEKEELANYNFQKDFLKPFEFIMTNNPGGKIRELIIRCLSNITLSRTANIKSGWKSMFSVFSYAAGDSESTIVNLAYDIVEKLATDYFHFISEQFFPECCNCLVSFAEKSNFKDISLKAIKVLGQSAAKLANGKVCTFPESTEGAPIFVDCDLHLKLWWPIFLGLARAVSNNGIEVRTNALNELFHILRNHGAMFDNTFWELVFRGVLLPLFDSVRYVGTAEMLKEENEWLLTTCLNALTHVVELFSYFFDRLSFLTNDILTLLASCILIDKENLASIGASCLFQLIMCNGSKWTPEMWTIIAVSLDHIIRSNIPVQILSGRYSVSDLQKFQPGDFSSVVTESSATDATSSASASSTKYSPEHQQQINLLRQKLSRSAPAHLAGGGRQESAEDHAKRYTGKSNIELLLIQSVGDIVFSNYNHLTSDHIMMLLKSVKVAYSFANLANNTKEIWNGNSPLRNAALGTSSNGTNGTSTGGSSGGSSLMSLLIKQEEKSLSIYLRILFRLYTENEQERIELAEKKLIKHLKKTIEEFLGMEVLVSSSNSSNSSFSLHTADDGRYYQSKVPVVEFILSQFQNLSDKQFLQHLPLFYPLFSEMILSETKVIRQGLKDVFLRIGRLRSIY